MRRRIALTAFLTALGTLSLAVFVGATAMAKAGTSPSSLIIRRRSDPDAERRSGAFRVSEGTRGHAASAACRALGFSPIAIPGIVTPVGVAVLIIFVSYFPSTADKVAIMGVVAAIMALNFAAMLVCRLVHVPHRRRSPDVLGAVFGVLQAAIGVEMLVSA